MVSAFASASALARQVRGGKVKAIELTEFYLDRIAKLDGPLNAVIQKRADEARVEARKLDKAVKAGAKVGPLAGVPITVKESYDVAGLPTTYGIPAFRDSIPTEDSVVVARLKAAGAIVLGKTNVPKFLAEWQSHNEIYGVTNNPWGLDRTPGGSSGGSAAAIAAGLSALEVGSDIGGSIRVPSHCCGVFGHKPTFALVPTLGHSLPGKTAPSDISVCGPLARSAADLDLALSAIAGPIQEMGGAFKLALPPAKRDPKTLKVALVTNNADFPVDEDTEKGLEDVAKYLKSRGVKVVRDAMPNGKAREMYELYILLLRGATAGRQTDADFDQNLKELKTIKPADRSYFALAAKGNTMSHRDWVMLNQQRYDLMAEWRAFFGDYDALLCPAMTTPAFLQDRKTPKHLIMTNIRGKSVPQDNDYYWHGLASVSHLPATVAPMALSRDGLPIGVQIVGPAYGDRATIGIARLLEQGFRKFSPPPGY